MAARDDAVLAALTNAWERIRVQDSRMPDVAWYLTEGRPTSCATASWDGQPVLRINLQRGGVNMTGSAIMDWLLHLAAHAIAGPTTSSEGRWHSEAYRAAAENLGLEVERGSTGWGVTSLENSARYRAEIGRLDKAMASWQPVPLRPRARAPERLQCACGPPRVIRVNAGVAARGPIVCGACGQAFQAG